MESCQNKVCFVCDSEMLKKGVCLSSEKTYFTQTAFPTKISQLIGDAFMVVVSEKDRLCMRCATLINRSDKLEMDWMEIRRLIIGFLNIKYNLNSEDDQVDVSEGLGHSKLENDCDDFNDTKVPHSKIVYNTHVQEDGQHTFPDIKDSTQHVEELKKSNYFIKNSFGNNLHIKSEPLQSKYSNRISFNKKQSVEFVSEELLMKSPADDSVSEIKSPLSQSISVSPDSLKVDSRVTCTSSPLNQQMPVSSDSVKVGSRVTHPSQDDIILTEVKKETISCDYTLSNQMFFLSNTTDEENILTSDQLNLSDGTSEFPSRCEVQQPSLLDEKPPKNLFQVSDESENKILPVEPLPQTCALSGREKRAVTKSPTKSLRNCLKKDKNSLSRKLRQILPKITHFNDVLTPLCIIKTSPQNRIVELSSNDSINNNAIKTKEVLVRSANFSEYRTVATVPNGHLPVEEHKSSEKHSTQHKTVTSLCRKLCKTTFEDLELIKRHDKEHLHNKKILECNFCQKVFKTKPGLQNHEAVHTGKFSFCCEICGQGFMSRGGLEEHRSSHTKEDRYICDVCGKKFHFQSTYWIHRKWHDNPYPYKCSDCGRPFKHTSLLAVHRRKHTGERPYKCPHCSLSFTVSNSLKRHLILHTKQYPFNCVSCDQGFTTRFKYTEHLVKTHRIIVDRPSVEKKDYKMAVYDNIVENISSEHLNMEEVGFESRGCVKDTENSVNSFPDELSESIVEIVLGPLQSCLNTV